MTWRWCLAVIGLYVVVAYANYFLAFKGAYNGPPGYDCDPTWSLGYHCIGPDGWELTRHGWEVLAE